MSNNNEVQDKIQKLISDAAISESMQRKILKEHLDSLDRADRECRSLSDDLTESHKREDKLKAKYEKLASENLGLSSEINHWKARETELNEWGKVLQDQQNDQELTNYKAKIATERKDEIKELFAMVVRNPTINRAVSGTVPLAVEGAPGMVDSNGYPTSQSYGGTVKY